MQQATATAYTDHERVEMTNTTAITVAQPRFELGQIREIAGAIAQSGLFGIKTEAQAYALMLIADAEGLHPATVAQDYDVIQGRPARKTHSVLARFQAAGGTVEWLELTSKRAEAKFSHPRGGSVSIEWTIEMATNAKLTGKDNWRMYPRAMLRARCIGEGVRAVYPAAIGGALLTEEAQDIDVIDVAATQPKRTQQAEPAYYSHEEFATSLPKWREVIESGRKSPEDLMAFATARSKRQFTPEQRQTMYALQKTRPKPEPEQEAEVVEPRMAQEAPAPSPAQEQGLSAEDCPDDAYGEAR